MLAIKGIYDGTVITPLEPVPFDEETDVIITFLKEVKKTKSKTDWRKLKGSAKGEQMLDTLLQSRREDLKREE
jgi:hypothetical protein